MTSEYAYSIWQDDFDEILIELQDKNGLVDLSSATVQVILQELSGSPRYEIDCIGNGSGVVSVQLTSAYTHIPGRYKLRVPVTINGNVSTWPDDGPQFIQILKAF
jgi:hypothetical protein